MKNIVFFITLILFGISAKSQSSIIDAAQYAEDKSESFDANILNEIRGLLSLDGGVIWIKRGFWNINDHVNIPENIALKISNGAILYISDGYTINMAGRIEAGVYPIFSFDDTDNPDNIEALDAGSVRWVDNKGNLKSAQTLYPEWWGANGDDGDDDYKALQRCFNVPTGKEKPNKIVLQPGKDYKLLSKGIWIKNFDTNSIQRNGGFILEGNRAKISASSLPDPAIRIGDLEQRKKCWNTVIENLQLVNIASQDFHNTVGIGLELADKGRILGCDILNFSFGLLDTLTYPNLDSRSILQTDNKYWSIVDTEFDGNYINIYSRAANVWRITGGKHNSSFRPIDINGENLLFENVSFSQNSMYYYFTTATFVALSEHETLSDAAKTLLGPVRPNNPFLSNIVFKSNNEIANVLSRLGIDPNSVDAFIIRSEGHKTFLNSLNSLIKRNETENSLIRLSGSSYGKFSGRFENNGPYIFEDNTRLISLSNCDFFTLENSYLNGKTNGGSWRSRAHMKYGVHFDQSQNITIQNNRFRNFQEAGIFIDPLSKNINIDNTNDGVSGTSIFPTLTTKGDGDNIYNFEALGPIIKRSTQYSPNSTGLLQNLIPDSDIINFDDPDEGGVVFTNSLGIAPDGISNVSSIHFSPQNIRGNIQRALLSIPSRSFEFSEQSTKVILRFWAKTNGFITDEFPRKTGFPIIRTYIEENNGSWSNHPNQSIILSKNWKYYEFQYDLMSENTNQLRMNFFIEPIDDPISVNIWGIQLIREFPDDPNIYYPYALQEDYLLNANLIEGPLAIAQGDRAYKIIYDSSPPKETDPSLWKVGDRIHNNEPQEGEFSGWIYTANGWKGFGKIEGQNVTDLDALRLQVNLLEQRLMNLENLPPIPHSGGGDTDPVLKIVNSFIGYVGSVQKEYPNENDHNPIPILSSNASNAPSLRNLINLVKNILSEYPSHKTKIAVAFEGYMHYLLDNFEEMDRFGRIIQEEGVNTVNSESDLTRILRNLGDTFTNN